MSAVSLGEGGRERGRKRERESGREREREIASFACGNERKENKKSSSIFFFSWKVAHGGSSSSSGVRVGRVGEGKVPVQQSTGSRPRRQSGSGAMES